MERPPGPRRKSTASDAEDLHAKSKTSRKSFVVGGTKNHHRVPSYGKKLNQLGKLTALTSADHKGADEHGAASNPAHNSPRRASIHRSHSQKSLTEHKVSSKRNGSTQNLQKLRRSSSHHASTARLSALKPMTKVADHGASQANDSKSDDTREPTTGNKRATFVLEDEEDEDADDVASSFANKAFTDHKLEIEQITRDMENHEIVSSPTQMGLSNNKDENLHEEPLREHVGRVVSVDQTSEVEHPNHQAHRNNRSASNPMDLLLGQAKKPVDPQLSTESAVSKDIQSKKRPQSGQMTPVNSQPLTSRFLESPRKDSLPPLRHMSSIYVQKDGEVAPSTNGASVPKHSLQQMYHSPHGSTTNLGLGASRTQQKLLLQRASSIRDLDSEIDDRDGAKNNAFIHPRAQKEFDRISREYKNSKRFRDPLKELSVRLYAKGLCTPAVVQPVQPLRRTMTHMGLNGYANDLRAPKISRSSSNLRQGDTAQSAGASGLSNDVSRILKLMWLKDDHIPQLEE